MKVVYIRQYIIYTLKTYLTHTFSKSYSHT